MNYKIILAASIDELINLGQDYIKELIEIPRDKAFGDYSFPCYKVINKIGKSPVLIAKEIKSGFRNEFLTDTKGNGIMNHVFCDYEPFKGEIPERSRGSLVVFESGTAITYGLFNAQERGTLFIEPGTEVYAGMVAGECSRADDIEVNICKKKHLSNTRSSGADDALKLTPVTVMSLEQSLEFVRADELVEVTPKSIRLRKTLLDPTERKRAAIRK